MSTKTIEQPAGDWALAWDMTKCATLSGLLLAVVVGCGVGLATAWDWASPWLNAALVAAILPPLSVAALISYAALRAGLELIARRDLDASGRGGDIRLIPVRGSQTIDGHDPRDLRHFIERLPILGVAQAAWRGERLPSGAVCDAARHTALCATLAKSGLVTEPGPRQARTLAADYDAAEALRIVGLN